MGLHLSLLQDYLWQVLSFNQRDDTAQTDDF